MDDVGPTLVIFVVCYLTIGHAERYLQRWRCRRDSRLRQ